jgi:hypothetical protein
VSKIEIEVEGCDIHFAHLCSTGTHSKTRKVRQLADGRGVEGGGGGAKSCDGEQPWSSINHSLLSDAAPFALVNKGSLYKVCRLCKSLCRWFRFAQLAKGKKSRP